MYEKYIRNLDFGKVINFKDLIGYVSGGVESRSLVQRDDFTLTLFGFDKGEEVSAYSIPGETLIHVLEGRASVVVDEKDEYLLKEGEIIAISKDILYSINAVEELKLMLVIIK